MDDEKKIKHLQEFIKKNPELGFSIKEYKIKLDLKKKISELELKGTKLKIPEKVKTYSKKARNIREVEQ